jgi:hypothetical protein
MHKLTSNPDGAHRLFALHERDAGAIVPEGGDWRCDRCGAPVNGAVAGYIKRAGALQPLCFGCFLELEGTDR